MTASWPDEVDAILGGDQVVALAYPTPASGAVLSPVTNFATRDRDAGTITVNSSVGMWRKLDRIRRNPRVALAFHTRQHGFSDRPEYVLAQGTARLSAPIADYPEALGSSWERFDGPRPSSRAWKRWLRVYYTRVEIEVAVRRLVVWPDLGCARSPVIHGSPLPDPPVEHRPPARGTRPRVDHRRAADTAAGLPNLLLGWVGGDGLPVVLPADVAGTDAGGISLSAPAGLVPAGGRRAGLTAHSFTRHVTGQHQRLHTGWLTAESGATRVRYSPHTTAGHRLPPFTSLYRLAVGFGTRRGLHRARRAGVTHPTQTAV